MTSNLGSWQKKNIATSKWSSWSINQIHLALIPEDPDDHRNIFLGQGYSTWSRNYFAGDLYRMYARFAESKNWSIEIVNLQDGDHGGFKEVIIKV